MDGARYLEDGKLTIFRRNGTYYARLRLSPGKYVTRSLKTSVEEIAVPLGRRLLFQLEHRAEQGLPSKSQVSRKRFGPPIDDQLTQWLYGDDFCALDGAWLKNIVVSGFVNDWNRFHTRSDKTGPA